MEKSKQEVLIFFEELKKDYSDASFSLTFSFSGGCYEVDVLFYKRCNDEVFSKIADYFDLAYREFNIDKSVIWLEAVRNGVKISVADYKRCKVIGTKKEIRKVIKVIEPAKTEEVEEEVEVPIYDCGKKAGGE